jgi:hypothetical protein
MRRSGLLRALPLAGACLALGGVASAQELNIDVSNLVGTPTSGYGAGAAQPGFWNSVDGGAIGTVFTLLDLGTGTTAASVSYQVYGNSSGNFTGDDPGTTGDDQALLDDFQDVGSGTSLAIWSFDGLSAGDYLVYTYAWAADDPTNSTSRVRVVGSSDPEQSLGGPWTGSHALGVTFARHAVTVGVSGQLVIEVQPSAGYASVNGIQLVDAGSGGGPAKFCTSRPSSIPGCVPTLSGPSSQVSLSAGSGSYDITAGPVPGGGSPSILIYTTNGLLGSPASTAFGTLCISQFKRLSAFPDTPGGSAGVCNGGYAWDFGLIATGLAAISPGDTLDIQAWYRDSPNPGGANLTDGIGSIVVTP